MTKELFIGGPLDGEWVNVDPGVSVMRWGRLQASGIMVSPAEPFQMDLQDVTTYWRHKMPKGFVWAPEGWSSERVFRSLYDNQYPKEDT